jgi:hypothetical protein
MKLIKKQRTQLLVWIAEGLETGEINKLAAKFKPPFKVTRQQVDHYRKTRDVKLDEIKAQDETSALTTGLSLKENRVKLLHDLAGLLSRDIFEGKRLWLDQAKGIGSAENYERIDYQEFNTAEVAQLRGLLDDIATEVGERVKRQEVTGKDGKPIELFDMSVWKQERDRRLKEIQKMEE